MEGSPTMIPSAPPKQRAAGRDWDRGGDRQVILAVDPEGCNPTAWHVYITQLYHNLTQYTKGEKFPTNGSKSFPEA